MPQRVLYRSILSFGCDPTCCRWPAPRPRNIVYCGCRICGKPRRRLMMPTMPTMPTTPTMSRACTFWTAIDVGILHPRISASSSVQQKQRAMETSACVQALCNKKCRADQPYPPRSNYTTSRNAISAPTAIHGTLSQACFSPPAFDKATSMLPSPAAARAQPARSRLMIQPRKRSHWMGVTLPAAVQP